MNAPTQFKANARTLRTHLKNLSAHLLHQLWNPNLAPTLPEELAQHPMFERAWQNLEPAQVWDMHTHLAGTGDSGEGIEIHPHMLSWRHPKDWITRWIYENGSGISGCLTQKDHAFTARMAALLERTTPPGAANAQHAKALLFAFDYFHDDQGQAQPEQSTFYIPNETAATVVRRWPHAFEWVASIHPYRADALDALDQAIETGAYAIKWLPAAMNMDPSDARCLPFYEKMAQHKLPMIIHCGKETAIKNAQSQALGNPLKLRLMLETGVRTVVAHCASVGQDVDLDIGKHGPYRSSFELFTRMMDASEYDTVLWGDISAIILRNRAPSTLITLLTRQDWHNRLLNGSDYPLPGIVPLISPQALARANLLDKTLCSPLERLRKHNPLYFDFVLKRHLNWEGTHFADAVFSTRNFFIRTPH